MVLGEGIRAVLEADNGRQALEATAANAGAIDLLISDVIMPGMNGRELAEKLSPQYPDLRRLFVSGYAVDHLEAHTVRGGVEEFLPKPFGPTALLRRVRQVLDAGRVIG